MGLPDNRPPNNYPPQSSAEEHLQAITENLRGLQQHLSSQLVTDIEQLMQRRARLMDDIEQLEGDYEQLQARYADLKQDYEATLSEQQQAQQQLWAKRLAQAIAVHLQRQLSEILTASPDAASGGAALPQTRQMLTALDQTLHSTLQSLQQDLNSYQSSLSQQVGRMHGLEQQGEAILAALINRLSQQLQTQMVNPTLATLAASDRRDELAAFSAPNQFDAMGRRNPPQATLPEPTPMPTTSQPLGQESQAPQASTTATTTASRLRKGLLLVALSTLALSVHNVLVGLIGFGGEVLGQITVARIFSIDIANSLMLLWLRMVVVLPLMALVAGWVYPRVWQDVRQLVQGKDRRPMLQVAASGSFLFLSQVLIYKSIAVVGPGVAVTLLFMYPLITVPLAWFLFGDRPTSLRLVVIVAVGMGVVFTVLPHLSADIAGGDVSVWGVGAAILASAAFALYLVSMQLSFRRLHPVPVSLLQFSTIFVLTSLILVLGSFLGFTPGQPSSQWGLYLGGALLGILTLLGYLFNNLGVRLMGAAQAAVVASGGPLLTAALAVLIIPGDKTHLAFIQWVGILLVTLGLVSLSLERLAAQRRKAKRA